MWLLHTKQKLRTENMPTSKHTGYYKLNHIYLRKPAKISTESCGRERWRLGGRYDVTESERETKLLLRLSHLLILLPPLDHFIYYIINTVLALFLTFKSVNRSKATQAIQIFDQKKL